MQPNDDLLDQLRTLPQRPSSAPLSDTPPTAASIAPADAPELMGLVTTPSPLEHHTPQPPFPPPAPGDLHGDRPTARPWLLIAAAALGLLATVVLSVLWSAANSRADDAERDVAAAEVERDAATQQLLDNDVELQTLRDQLVDARDALAAAETAPPVAPDEAIEPGIDADTAELESTIAALETEIERLTTENADLTAFIDAIESADAIEDPPEPEVVPEPAPEPEPAPAPGPTAFDVSTTPQFARYVGEILSSRSGGSRLGQAQSECFGAAVVREIGLDGLGAGLNNSATSASNNAVIGAMQTAAATCNIDPGLIFG